jgi:acetyl-CoA acetyltransferase
VWQLCKQLSSRLLQAQALTMSPPNSTTKNPDDVVITMAIRTPLTKGKKGGMKDTSLDFMVYSLLKEVRERMNVDPAIVEDICLGNVRSRQPRYRAMLTFDTGW